MVNRRIRRQFSGYRDNDSLDAQYISETYRGVTIAAQIVRSVERGSERIRVKALTDDNTELVNKFTWCNDEKGPEEVLRDWLPDIKDQVDEFADEREETEEKAEQAFEVIRGP